MAAMAIAPCGISQSTDLFDYPAVEIDVSIPDEGWHDTLVNRKKRDDKTPLIGELTFAGKTYSGIEIRYKGNSSFHGTIKHGGNKLPIKFETPKGEVFDGGYDELRLSNNFRDPSAVRELLSYKIAATYVPTPRIGVAVVTINGEYLGVYTMTEGMSDRMLEEYYCNSDGVLVKCDPQFDLSTEPGCPKGEYSNLKYLGEEGRCYEHWYHVKSPREIRSIVELTRKLSESSDPETYLNVHEALWMHALNNVLVNLDSYLGIFTHNYFIYKDEYDMYHPLIWDLNLSFGGFTTLDQQVYPEMETMSPITHDKYLKGRRPLIQSLTQDKRHMYTYFYMINTIVRDWFANGKYLEEGRALQSVISPYREKESDPVYTMADFYENLEGVVKRDDKKRSIPGISGLMEPRVEYLQQHPLLQRQAPKLLEWSTEKFDGGLSVSFSSDTPLSEAYIYYKAEECGPLIRKEMLPLSTIAWQVDVEGLSSCYFFLATDKGVSLAPSAAPGEVFVTGS